MDDYLRQYIQDKKNLSFDEFLDKIKIPQSAMIPTGMSQVNLNQLRNPMNMPKMPINNMPYLPKDTENIPQNIQTLKNIPQNFPVPTNQARMSMFNPRFMPPNMNPMLLQQQQQQMLMKNPMFMQWMRPQLMQNMMMMKMMNNNQPTRNLANQQMMNPQQANMNHMNMPIHINPSQIPFQSKILL